MENKKRNKVLDFLQGNMVPILFTVLCLASIKISGQNAGYVITETVSRVGRNAILIVSLILPVLCGMGLNFSIVLGAMAGEIGLILITHWSYDGLKGIILAGIIATVLSIVSRSFFADSSYMLSFSVLCSCVCSRLISPSVSSWHKQDNTLMHQSPGHIQRRTPYNF